MQIARRKDIHSKQQSTSKGQSEAQYYVKMLTAFKSFSSQVILSDYYYFGPLNRHSVESTLILVMICNWQ
jgi:hypothetical protein